MNKKHSKSAHVCAYHCAQLSYTVQHRIVLIYSLLSFRQSLWSPYVIGQTIIFSSCFFLFFPRLISAVGDWMFTILQHMVWP